MSLNSMLRVVRWELGELTQLQVCERMKAAGVPMHVSTFTQLERRQSSATIEKAKAIAEALGVHSDVLWEVSKDNDKFMIVRTRTAALEAQAREQLGIKEVE